ncbi:hypothetical protein N9556_00395 [bacterium]|jgi:hypothetical protein|nr:hypothetical protein [bacterium]
MHLGAEKNALYAMLHSLDFCRQAQKVMPWSNIKLMLQGIEKM